mmetsp:Transcript_44867/g.116224  ORF Transcript_44867/g.116224 Transcript_44867/m.116224 type:complete len:453 (-) Transcript_44867:35-1393(-)
MQERATPHYAADTALISARLVLLEGPPLGPWGVGPALRRGVRRRRTTAAHPGQQAVDTVHHLRIALILGHMTPVVDDVSHGSCEARVLEGRGQLRVVGKVCGHAHKLAFLRIVVRLERRLLPALDLVHLLPLCNALLPQPLLRQPLVDIIPDSVDKVVLLHGVVIKVEVLRHGEVLVRLLPVAEAAVRLAAQAVGLADVWVQLQRGGAVRDARVRAPQPQQQVRPLVIQERRGAGLDGFRVPCDRVCEPALLCSLHRLLLGRILRVQLLLRELALDLGGLLGEGFVILGHALGVVHQLLRVGALLLLLHQVVLQLLLRRWRRGRREGRRECRGAPASDDVPEEGQLGARDDRGLLLEKLHCCLKSDHLVARQPHRWAQALEVLLEEGELGVGNCPGVLLHQAQGSLQRLHLYGIQAAQGVLRHLCVQLLLLHGTARPLAAVRNKGGNGTDPV